MRDALARHMEQTPLQEITLYGRPDTRMSEAELRWALRWAMKQHLDTIAVKPREHYLQRARGV